MSAKNLDSRMKVCFDNKIFTPEEFAKYFDFLLYLHGDHYIRKVVDYINDFMEPYFPEGEEIKYLDEAYELLPVEVQQEVTNMVSEAFLNLMQYAIENSDRLEEFFLMYD